MPGPNPPRSHDWYRIAGRLSTRWLIVAGLVIATLLAVILILDMNTPELASETTTTISS